MSASNTVDYERAGLVDARSMYANVTMSLVVTGIHLFMALYGLSVFLETRPDLRKGRRRYIAVSFAITILVAFSSALDAFFAFRLLFESTSAEGYWDVMYKYRLKWDRVASPLSGAAMVFAGDFLLVYRCYIIWKDRWYLAIPPALTCIGALALDIVVQSKHPDPNFFIPPYESARVFLTVSTNLFVTGTITIYLLRARRSFSKFLPSRYLKLYTGVFTVLIESAAPLAAFGLAYAVIIVYTPKETTSATEVCYALSNIFAFFFYALASLSPHMIIFRVTTGRSWVQFPKENGVGGLSNPIGFARGGETTDRFIESVLNRDLGSGSQAGHGLSTQNV